MLETLLSYSYPNEINNTDRGQDFRNMAEKMNKLFRLLKLKSKTSGRDKTMVNHVLPPEILKKILEKLDLKSLGFAKQTCKRWKEIIDVFELKTQASRKFIVICTYKTQFLIIG